MTRRRTLLLIEPPFYRLFHPRYSLDSYPASLGALASYVRRETDWNVAVYNADFVPGSRPRSYRYLWTRGFARYVQELADTEAAVWREVRARIAAHAPDVVGISSTTPVFGSACRVAGLVKEASARTLVVLGGAHASAADDAGLGCVAFDLSVRGEGELTLVDLLRAVEADRPFETVAGIVCRRHGVIRDTPVREPIPDLDALPYPHEDAPEVLDGYARYPITAFRNLMTSRGCPFGCVFCGSRSVWGRRVRRRSAEHVVGQMLSLRQAGIRVCCFADDSFGADRASLRALCERIRAQCRGMQWRCLMHASTIDDESVSWVKAAGCYAIEVGAESGNARVLAALGKGVTLETIMAACRAVQRAGLELQINLMVGFPWDTEQTIEETLALADRVRPDHILYSVFTPYPGTEAFAWCHDQGLLGGAYDPTRHFPFSPATQFAPAVPAEKLRAITERLWRLSDRRARRYRARHIFTTNALRRIQEAGPRDAMCKGIRIVLGR